MTTVSARREIDAECAELTGLAALIRREREPLLAAWRERVRALPAARDLDVPTLNDHVPDLLEELACELLVGCDPASAPHEVTDNPEIHGRQRHEVGFDVEQVVAECGMLRQCIRELAESNGFSLCGEPGAVVSRVIDGAIAVAVRTFVEQQREELRRRREEHMAFVAHDLKTPLSVISMSLSILERELPPEVRSGTTGTLLEAMRRNARRLDSMIKAVVREEAQIDPDETPKLRRRQLDLWPLVQGIIYDLGPLAKRAGTRLVNSVPESLVVCADAPALTHVFQNLLSNALRHTPGGVVTVEAMPLGRDGAECRVVDTGEGIPADLVGCVFDKGVKDPKGAGTGLGLAIVRQVVEAHGGRVDVDSTRGKGSAFIFTLPETSDGGC